MANLDDVLALLKKDPVKGYVTIAVLAARPPNPAILVKLKGRSLVLPDWDAGEWQWYGKIALDIGARLRIKTMTENRAGDLRGVDRAAAKVKSLMPNRKPTPQEAAAFYDACVRLIIAARAAADEKTFTEISDESLREASKEIPLTIGSVIASLLRGPVKDILIPATKAAAEILVEIFEEVAKSGLGLIVVIGLGLYLWSQHGKGESYGEA